MRLMRLTTAYPAYLEQFYRRRPDLSQADFATQYRALRDDSYGWSDFWSDALEPLGYEVFEPLANAECQQRAWAREHGITPLGPRGWESISLAQAVDFQPEILFSNDHRSFDYQFLLRLRERCPSVRLVVGWCGAPYGSLQDLAGYDLLLSNISDFVWRFRTAGLSAAKMAHAFSPLVLKRMDRTMQADHAFTFLGSVVRYRGFHRRREKLLNYLSRRTDLQLSISVSGPEAGRWPWRSYRKWLPSRWPASRATGAAAIGAPANGPLFGISMFQRLSQSQVTLNNHIDVASDSASNMRLFEATGVGTCLLTEWQPDLPNYFEPDTEVVTYRSPREAVERYRWLRDHPESRQTIAAAGQRRTLRDHTFARRAPQLDALIRTELARPRRRSA